MPRQRGADPDAGLGDVAPLASRRAVALAALAAVLLFAGVAGALAWRQYRDAQRAALKDARGRATLTAAVFDVYFSGQLGTLSSIAQAPVVRNADEAGMLAYFKRVQPPGGKLFPGGLSWINRAGVVRVSTVRSAPGDLARVADRPYFARAIRTGKPFVSEGVTARLSGKQVFVSAVPSRDASGAVNGVVTARCRSSPIEASQSAVDLGLAGLAIVDREISRSSRASCDPTGSSTRRASPPPPA